MNRDLTPIHQRPLAALQMKFDRLTSNKLVADAVEAFAILQELQRRALIASINNDNEASIKPSLILTESAETPGPGVQQAVDGQDGTSAVLNSGGPDGAAG